MKEKILSALKNKYKNLGFTEKTLEQVSEYLGQTVTEETGIEPAVNGAELLLKSFQSDIDKRVSDAVAKAKAEGKPPEQTTTSQPNNQSKQNEDIPAWAKIIMDRFDGIEKQQRQTGLLSRVKSKLTEKRIPESYYRSRTLSLESETDIDKLVTEIEADYTAFRQDLVNQGIIISVPSEGQGDKADEAMAKSIAEKRNNPTAATGVAAKKLI